MLTGKKYLQQLEKEEVNYAVICKPKVLVMKTIVSDMPEEISKCWLNLETLWWMIC